MFVILIYKFEFWSRIRIAGISKQTTDNLLVEHEKLFFLCGFFLVCTQSSQSKSNADEEEDRGEKRKREREKKCCTI